MERKTHKSVSRLRVSILTAISVAAVISVIPAIMTSNIMEICMPKVDSSVILLRTMSFVGAFLMFVVIWFLFFWERSVAALL
jgi:hypothetical protein